MFCKLFCCIVVVFKINFAFASDFSPELTRIWGPGLQPDVFVLPARYFFIQAVDNNNNRYFIRTLNFFKTLQVF